MKVIKWLFFGLLIVLVLPSYGLGNVLEGAGSTAVLPMIQGWSQTYLKQTGIKINYQGVGSGQGISYLKDHKVNFSLTDMPLSHKVLQQRGWYQYPIVISQVVVIYNLPGVHSHLELDGKILSDIFLGKVSKWNDPLIQKLNPHSRLPNKKIKIVYRSDESGTVYTFSSYLSRVSKRWAKTYGNESYFANMPKGAIGFNSNGQVVAAVEKIPFSISFADSVYVYSHHIGKAALINKAGTVVLPEKLYAYAALSNVSNRDFFTLKNLTNIRGNESWPILNVTYVLLPKRSPELNSTIHFLHWGLTKAVSITDSLGYVPIPERFSENIKLFAV